MSKIKPRSHQRMDHPAPIRFALLNSEQFQPTQLFNYSEGGLCYETNRPLSPEDEVCIVMENYTPGQPGPEGYRSYLTEVRWTDMISQNGTQRYANGAEWVLRSHDILSTQDQLPHQFCDLCDARLPQHKLKQTANGVRLCKACIKHYHNIPAGKIRQCVERFLVGNVI